MNRTIRFASSLGRGSLLAAALILLLPVRAAESAAVTWPEITSTNKPWSRWWWLGSIVSDDGLRSEMKKYADAGLGGLEITPIYGVHGYEDQFIDYLSPEWMERFTFALEEARRLGLGIDMATGNGWPFGGPWVGPEDASKYLAHARYTVAAGARLQQPVRFIQQPLVRFAGPTRVPIDQIRQPVSANDNLQALALDQVRFEKPLPLVALLAYPENGDNPLDLTDRVGADGSLDWTAPTGKGAWTLYALFQGWHGKQVERAGPGGEGNVIDHFSADALHHYLARFDRAFAGHDVGGLRGFFNDSYEVDDAQGESDWTPGFLDEFERRRGYDLRTQLPALFGDASPEASSRVLADYWETISDLLRDEFTRSWRDWAHTKQAIVRNQAHGSPANILDLYAASDIPEQEGSDIVAIKMASSAAHVTGKPLASAETGTWLDEHFLGTLEELSRAADRFFLGGINHNCYHGTAYSPPDVPWPGFQFYASVELNPANSYWDHFGALNHYVARVQSLLQSGQPDEDVLLYYNIHDRWAQRRNGTMPHFAGRAREGVSATALGRELLAAGYGFDFVSDRMLAGVTFEDGVLRSGNTSYRAVVLPETHHIPLETMRRLINLARDGATIVVQGTVPDDVPGFNEYESRRQELAALTRSLRPTAPNDRDRAAIETGAGRFLIGSDVSAMLEAAGVARETMVDRQLGFVRRRDVDLRFYFIVNRSEEPVDGWVPLAWAAQAAAILNPLTDELGLAAVREEGEGEGISVYLQLAPGESCLVRELAGPGSTPRYGYWEPGEPEALSGQWTVEFVQGGPKLPDTVKTDRLRSWTDFGGDAVKSFSGMARYRLSFPRPAGESSAWWLDLGRVAETAHVRLNGTDLGTFFRPPYRARVPETLLRSENILEVEVANLMANRIADLDRRHVDWKIFYNTNMPARRPANRGPDGNFTAEKWEPRTSGLLGPVTLTPLTRLDPQAR